MRGPRGQDYRVLDHADSLGYGAAGENGMSSHAQHLRRALKLLAETPGGCSVAMLLAHGFDAAFLGALLEAGVAVAQVESVMIGGHARQARRLWITEAGRRLLMGRY